MHFLKKFSAEILRLVVFATIIGAVGASGQVYKWSQTAGSNANADPHINWAEGQAPSSINDSARAMMAALAGFRDDISGKLLTGGTSTAYTITSNQGFASQAVMDGQMLAFTVSVTNGASATLNVDGLGAAALITDTVSGTTPAPSGALTAGSVYRATYYSSGNNWRLEGSFTNSFNIPLGGFLASTSPSPPNSSFIEPAGQCISTTTYANYWVLLGSPASGGCPGGQFAVIDVRGSALVGLDNLNASTANRLTSSATGCGTAMTTVGARCANGTESKTLITANLPPYTPGGSISGIASSVETTVQRNASNITVGTGGSNTIGVANPGVVTVNGNQYSFAGSAQGGISTPVSSIMPAIGVKYYLRVL